MSRNRDIEWLLACLLVALGVAVRSIPDNMLSPFLQLITDYGVVDDVLTIIMIVIGSVWMVGLKINGSWPGGTPWIRLGCAILGTGMWGFIWTGISLNGPSTGVATYGVVTAFSIVACARCGADAAKALIAARKRRETI